jgi:outer membrane protein OmpA-like peptidoglycan-associated protein
VRDDAGADALASTLSADLLAPLPRRFALDEIRRSLDVRAYMRGVDVRDLKFRRGTWTLASKQSQRLERFAIALKDAIHRNPDEVFLIEGVVQGGGSDVDNLSLADRRAQEVATALTRSFGVPAENLVTQGYAKRELMTRRKRVSSETSRITLQRITPLLNGR